MRYYHPAKLFSRSPSILLSVTIATVLVVSVLLLALYRTVLWHQGANFHFVWYLTYCLSANWTLAVIVGAVAIIIVPQQSLCTFFIGGYSKMFSDFLQKGSQAPLLWDSFQVSAFCISSMAFLEEVSVYWGPAIIIASSVIRDSSSRSSSMLTVRAPDASLLTLKCASAKAAIWGR